jgi:plastocyanin
MILVRDHIMQSYVLITILTGLLISGASNYLVVYAGQYSGPTITQIQSNMTGLVDDSNALVPDDHVIPTVHIVEPGWCTAVKPGNILVKGTSADNGSGIKIVEVHVDKNEYSAATPKNTTDWSSWSISVNINDNKPHRIQARVTDNSGNQNWEDITINSPLGMGKSLTEIEPVKENETRIAFVESTFTSAAYSANHFYAFYDIHESATEEGDNVTENLDMLTAGVPQEVDREYFLNFTEHVSKFIPNADVEIIRDEDLHNGHIFGPDGSNLYDVLFLLHDEYVSDEGYNNLKRFVSDGGIIVFLDGNVFYAQVRYDPVLCTVTLVKGHDWEFDGKKALKTDHEAYFDDKKEWVGSNFLYGDISEPVRFLDNPFNYTRFEENYVSNQNATVLYDYGAQIPESILSINNATTYPKIATYELNYGRGKVIMLGLYSQNMAGNEAFMDFFDRIILPRTLGQSFKHSSDGQNESVSYWWMETGNLSGITVDNQSNTVTLILKRAELRNDTLFITLPKEMTGGKDPKLLDFTVTVDNREVTYNQTPDDVENGFVIPLAGNATMVQISVIANNTDVGLVPGPGPVLDNGSLSKSLQNRSELGAANVSQPTNNAPIIQIVDGAYSVTSTEFYNPSIITIPPGTVVTWTNGDIETHTVTSGNLETGISNGKLFDSGFLAPGKTYEHIFKDKGIFDYFCTIHPFMKAKVVVK